MVHRVPQFERNTETIERDHRAAEMRARGMTYPQIGAQFGVTRQAAHQMVQRAIADIPTEGGETIKSMELMKLDAIERRAYLVANSKHPVVSASGKIVKRVVDQDGSLVEQELEDDGPVLKALDTLLKVQERRARLLGLNAPTNVRVETVSYDPDAVDAELEQFRALLAGSGDPATLLDGPEGAA
jgi:hypothetical protein